MRASSAYAQGATGAGIIVAVIDTGALQVHPDLQGQFTGPTFDVNAATRQSDDIDRRGHGTLIAGIIAAKRDGVGIHGVAFGAKVLDIRADRPGSCQQQGTDGGCRYPVPDIITGINYAIANGAKIINLSLGSEPTANTQLEQAILNAAAQGVLIVISAGNDAEPASGSTPAKGTSPNSPGRAAGFSNNLGRVVAVGSVIARDDPNTPQNEIGRLSGFSNRAGPQAKFAYLLAPGEGVTSTGPDDDIVLPGNPNNDADDIGNYFRISGTSFAAPYVAGALALMLQRFPNLQATPERALRILLDTADDYVDPAPDPVLGIPAAPGIDDVSGVGVMNLQRAFQPQGIAQASFNGALVPLSLAVGSASGAFGDWAAHGGLFEGVALIDKYERAFPLNAEAMNLEPRAPIAGFEAQAANFAGDHRALRAGQVELSWQTPKLHQRPGAPYQEEPDPQISATFRFDSGKISVGQGGGLPRLAPQAGLVAEPGAPRSVSSDTAWALVSKEAGPVDVQVFTSSGYGESRLGAGLSRMGENWSLAARLEQVEDSGSALGGTVQGRIGEADRSTLTAVSVEGRADLAAGLTLSGGAEFGAVDLPGIDASGVAVSRWSLGVSRAVGPGMASLIVAQPWRAESGVLSVSAVTGADTDGFISETRSIGLTPSGRQLNLEARYRIGLGAGWFAEAAAAQVNAPNHVAGASEATAAWLAIRGTW